MNRPLTPNMKLALMDAKRGRLTSPPVNCSTLNALRSRGLVTHSGELTPAGRDAIDLEQFGTIHRCIRCGTGIQCLHSIPMGNEVCPRCRKDTSKGGAVRRGRSTEQAVREYEGGYYE